MIKYRIFQHSLNEKETNKTNKILFSINSLSLPKDQTLKLYNIYDKIIVNSQKLAQIQLNSQLLLITKQSQDWLLEMHHFFKAKFETINNKN